MIQVCECILTTMDTFLAFCPDHEKKINLLPKKFINRSPPFDQHFCKSTHANCWNFILICYCHFLLLILQRLLWFLWISIWSFFFFSRQKFLIKDQFEFGMNPHEVLECFRRYSKIILDSDRLSDSFRESNHVFILWKKVQKDSANDYAQKYIVAL